MVFPFCISRGKICARDLWAYFQMGINICSVLENMVLQSFMKTLYSSIRDVYSFTSLFIQQAHTVHYQVQGNVINTKDPKSNVLPTLKETSRKDGNKSIIIVHCDKFYKREIYWGPGVMVEEHSDEVVRPRTIWVLPGSGRRNTLKTF